MRLFESYETGIRHTLMIILFGVIMLACQTSLYGHYLGQSYAYLKIYDDKITGRFEVIIGDLNKALSADQEREPLTQENLVERIDEVQEYISKNLKFYVNDKLLPIRFSQVDTLKTKGVVFALLDFTLIEEGITPDAIDVEYSVMFDAIPTYTGMVLIEQYWRGNIFKNENRPSLVFSGSYRRQSLDLSNYSMFSGFTGVVKLGIKHIWLGIDHILFLVALILPAAMIRRSRDWEPVSEFRFALFYLIKIVTLFTIAHTLTLSLARLDLVNLPTRLVESVIAISITIAALDILYPIFKKKIALVVFIFGVFHGFWFASVLSHLGVLDEHVAWSLIGFNLGIAIGQVVIILIIFPILYQIRTYSFFPKFVMKYGAVALIMISVVWFVERAILDSPVKRFVEASLYQLLS